MGHVIAEWLGRGVVVAPDAPAPEEWAHCERQRVGSEEVAKPAVAVGVLHDAWLARRPVVVELAVAPSELNEAERCDLPPFELEAGFSFERERLAFLVWANNYDHRSGQLVWWHGRKAARRHAGDGVHEGGTADLVTADGDELYVDGGPPHPADPPAARVVAVVTRWNAEAGTLRKAGYAQPSAELAVDQLAAVAHACGPARIIAPAGSGKTRVLTERLRHLVVDLGVDPGCVTALAFNTKAAEDLRGRCADFHTRAGPHIRTLNSLGLSICNNFGTAGRMRVLEEPAVRGLIQSVFGVRRQSNTDTVLPYIDGLSMVRLSLTHPEDVEDEVSDAPGLSGGFGAYREALARAGAVDFDEQIYRAIEILLTDPSARAAAQQLCRFLLVDEFQDLNPAHVLLIRLLCAPGFDCFGVGDDDQVIYGYAGADPGFLINYRRYFPGAAEHALEVNYRCPLPVVDAAMNLLANNRRRVPKSIRAASEGGAGAVSVRPVPADTMAEEAIRLLASWLEEGVSPDDIALLARVNSTLLPVQVSCHEAGVPCSMPVGEEVLGRTGVRTALAYLRIGLDPGRITAADLRDVIRRPSRGISPMVTDMLTKPRGTSLEDLRRLASRLTGRDAPKLELFADDLERLVGQCKRGTTASVVRFIRVGIGLDETMDVLDSSRREADRSTHTDDLVALQSVAQLHPEVPSFEGWLRSTFGRQDVTGPRVLLSTVHKIKGREWPRVIVFGASVGLFPHRLSDDEEGERRVFHVAITRCREMVVVLTPSESPSHFVAEMSGSRRPEGDRPPRRAGGREAVGERGERREAQSAAGQRAGGGAGGERQARRRQAGEGKVSPLEEALRTWRRASAARDGVKPFVILSDRELIGIAEKRPTTLAKLARCPGIGPVRLERWGEEIVALIGTCIAEEGVPAHGSAPDRAPSA